MKKLLCSLFLLFSASVFASNIEIIAVTKQMARFNYLSGYKLKSSMPDCSKNYTANSEVRSAMKNVFSKLEAKKWFDGFICEAGSGYVCIANVEIKNDGSITKVNSVKKVLAKEKMLCNEFELQPD